MEDVWGGLPRRECANAPFSCSTEKTQPSAANTWLPSYREVTICVGVSIEDDCSVPDGLSVLNLAHLNGGLTFVFLRYRELNAVTFGQTAESLRDD